MSASNKESTVKTVKNAQARGASAFGCFGTLILMVGVLAGGVMTFIGGTDRKNAEQYLKDEGYKVQTYQGKGGVFEREKNYYSDKFNVVTPAGVKQEVIVTRGYFSDVSTIRRVNP